MATLHTTPIPAQIMDGLLQLFSGELLAAVPAMLVGGSLAGASSSGGSSSKGGARNEARMICLPPGRLVLVAQAGSEATVDTAVHLLEVVGLERSSPVGENAEVG